jgi:hypothetical protein
MFSGVPDHDLGADVFYTFDRWQGMLATAVGLKTR